MYSYILLKYAMYQGNFTNPFVLRYDVEYACHTVTELFDFPK